MLTRNRFSNINQNYLMDFVFSIGISAPDDRPCSNSQLNSVLQLQNVEYIDLAEQCLATLALLSEEQGNQLLSQVLFVYVVFRSLIARKGVISSSLLYLDFFSLQSQVFTCVISQPT
jgi:hypothetical protein